MSAFRNFLITFLTALIIFGLLGIGAVKLSSKSIFNGNVKDPEEKGTDTAETEVPDEPVHDITGISGDSFTALFVLSDYRPDLHSDYTVNKTETDEYGFPKQPREITTPVIVLEHVSKETGECILCGIPANTKTTVDGLSCKIDELYAKKGIEALCSKVMAMTGIPIDYYAVTDADRLIGMIDSLGGISYYVDTVVDYVTDEETGETIHIGRGANKLDGEQVAAMLLCENYNDVYNTRRRVSVSFIHEFLKKFISEGQNDMENSLVNFYRFSEYIDTNFDTEEFSRQSELIYAFQKLAVTEYTYPGSSFGSGADARFSANVNLAADYFLKFKFKG